jgi:hypothetical protein
VSTDVNVGQAPQKPTTRRRTSIISPASMRKSAVNPSYHSRHSLLPPSLKHPEVMYCGRPRACRPGSPVPYCPTWTQLPVARRSQHR